MRYFIRFSYFGKAYHGWQNQPNAITVQEVLENALSTLLRKKIEVVGAGRTDAGVHAKEMFAHFDFDLIANKEELTYRLNAFLPDDVSIQEIVQVNLDAHARFDAIERTYEYWIVQEKNPFCSDYLRSVGYTDLIRIPEHVVGKFMLPGLKRRGIGVAPVPGQISHADLSLLDFVVDNRFINATNAMVIDTTRCVGCDDCVRACAAAHDGIPRFVRTGRTHANLMVTSACMHCTDPVCLIDCPTGAIHRDAFSGSVVINDDTCIGCATCSSACPYNNIQMREVTGPDGAILIDEDGSTHLKATKCDLCAGQSGGPACQRACPHDALTRIDIRDIDILSDRQSRV